MNVFMNTTRELHMHLLLSYMNMIGRVTLVLLASLVQHALHIGKTAIVWRSGHIEQLAQQWIH